MSYSAIEDAWFITGPTACGKSELALAVAEKIGAEILSLDSMAIYRGMDIGTAKPTIDQRLRVAHHLIDLVDVHQEFSVADYVAAAHHAANEVRQRGRIPLFVGGTPLYLKALLRGLFVGPQADWSFRKRLQAEAETHGPAALHARLVEVDPPTAVRLHPNDLRRVIRALEVYAQTGTPISELQQQFNRARPARECHCFVVQRPREELYGRINARVDAMFATGLVDETLRLVKSHGALSRTAGQAVGYREVIEHLHGMRDLPSTIELVKTRTRQFAKRQLTWFRSLEECQFVGVGGLGGDGHDWVGMAATKIGLLA